jgi:deoxycytidylate deaminase
MQKFIERGIAHVKRIFPEIYENRSIKGSYHFSLAYDRNKLIAVGVNKPDKINAKAYKTARQFGLTEKLIYPMIHAEENMISRLLSLDKLSSSLNILVIRMNKFYNLCSSKPCPNCDVILKAYGLNRIWYSNSEGGIERLCE